MKNLRKKIAILILLTGGMFLFLTGQAECGIVLKAMVLNPSKIKTQTAVLKAYLPKEVRPKDIISLGDLKIDYDITKALYYVYKEIDLAPGESASRSVEMKDVWVIPRAEIEDLSKDTGKLIAKLKDTAYYNAAVILQKDIRRKSADILRKQKLAKDVLPQTHIAVYRENIKTLDSIKALRDKLKNMLLEAKAASGSSGRKVSVRKSWWLIAGVIIVLGLLSLVFIIFWHYQVAAAALKQKTEMQSDSEEK